ncbi:hypothetical protein D9758_011599 [Tetrapyrgos nigripes]|uniref:Fungal-type protein kinase domain-containing protein n=1 Tax=Tetrapyrgos nigripes TaxID=182062 RepID=A0A8H5CPX8_9AGAR|nr:hypothetical protein D9758_011599 [Tetrapyrgos nigripes]
MAAIEELSGSGADSYIKHKGAGVKAFRSRTNPRTEHRVDLARAMDGKITAFADGVVPSLDWETVKDKFQPRSVKGGKGKTCPNAQLEGEMCIPLVEAFTSCMKDTFICENTSRHPDHGNDLTVYEKERCPDRLYPSDASTSDFNVKIKDSKDPNAFVDKVEDDKACIEYGEVKEAKKTADQIFSYAILQLARQYRTHLFSIYIHGGSAQLFRFDRAGVIVTKVFDYTSAPHLAQFLWRYTHATAAARGHDTTVTRYPTHYKGEVVERARKHLGLKNKVDPPYKFAVWEDDDKDGKPRYYYGGKPSFNGAHCITGRSTRAIPVWDDEGSMARQVSRSGDVRPESDSQYHSTLTQDHSTSKDFRLHMHYRLVMKEVCKGIFTTFTDTKQLITVLRDALIAHQDAYEKAKILHRDVSVGNILITEDGRGLLADWEFSRPLSEMPSRQTERIGTWQFISAALLSTDRPPHKLEDDLESFHHVFSWTALRHILNSLDPNALAEYLHFTYDYVAVPPNNEDGGPVQVNGGPFKESSMVSHRLSRYDFRPSIIHDLIADFEVAFATRYSTKSVHDQEDLAELLSEYEATEKAGDVGRKIRLARLSSHILPLNVSNLQLG